MNDLALHAETTLRTHPHAALRLTELLELLTERYDPSLTADRLRLALRDHPDHFRIFEAWNGRWLSDRTGELARDPWVIVVTDPCGRSDEHKTALRLRESVRWLARAVDPRSQLDVSRWYALALSERCARASLARRALRSREREAA